MAAVPTASARSSGRCRIRRKPRPTPRAPPRASLDPGPLTAPPPTLPKPDPLKPPPDFVGPTDAELFTDPSYKFRFAQGADALQRSAAARGVLNTGGTLKDLVGYGQDLASQEYGHVYDRKLDAYKTQWGIAKDVNDSNYQTQYKDPNYYDFNTWIEAYNHARNNANDDYDHKYRVLDLWNR